MTHKQACVAEFTQPVDCSLLLGLGSLFIGFQPGIRFCLHAVEVILGVTGKASVTLVAIVVLACCPALTHITSNTCLRFSAAARCMHVLPMWFVAVKSAPC